MNFVREEAELENDPIFSPDALKAESEKTGAQTKWGWKNKSKKKDDSDLSTNSLVKSGTPHPSDLASLTKPFADQTDQACPFAMVSMPLSSAANFSRVQ